jgi:hypothetical protein
MRRHLVLIAAALLAAFGASARADTILHADLSTYWEPVGGQLGTLRPVTDAGAPRPFAIGTATLVLNDAQTQMTLSATIFDIDVTGNQTPNDTRDNLRAAHIHAANRANPSTTNATVVWGFHGTPFNDNNPMDVVVTPFASGVGGTFTSKWDAPEGNSTTLAAQIDNLLNDFAYLNFHTEGFPGGEIRGTIVPEPSSIVMAGVAVIGGLAAYRWRRRRAS